MVNIFLVPQILLLFHPPRGSWNKSAQYEKYWSWCTRNRILTVLQELGFEIRRRYFVIQYHDASVQEEQGCPNLANEGPDEVLWILFEVYWWDIRSKSVDIFLFGLL